MPSKSKKQLELFRLVKAYVDGGPDGLTVIGRILKDAHLFLRRPGCIVMEIGAGQAAQVSDLVTQSHGYRNHRFLKDYSGIDRVLVAERAYPVR